MKIGFFLMRINHFHINSFLRSVALKQRLVVTRKLPIVILGLFYLIL